MKKAVFLLLIGATLLNSGCYALRKKFVRKQKYVEEPPVYVDFKNYPDKPSREAYINYYLFVKGWTDELKECLIQTQNLKRQKRAINEAIMNLEQIIGFYNQQGKEKIYPLYENLLAIRKEIVENPSQSLMKKNSLISKIEHFKRNFESKFAYGDVEQWLQ